MALTGQTSMGTVAKVKSQMLKSKLKSRTTPLSTRLFVMLLHLWALVACLVLLSKVKRKLSSFIRPGKPRLF